VCDDEEGREETRDVLDGGEIWEALILSASV
jgi:hypothetical protein